MPEGYQVGYVGLLALILGVQGFILAIMVRLNDKVQTVSETVAKVVQKIGGVAE